MYKTKMIIEKGAIPYSKYKEKRLNPFRVAWIDELQF
jgi:hypothetical protein